MARTLSWNIIPNHFHTLVRWTRQCQKDIVVVFKLSWYILPHRKLPHEFRDIVTTANKKTECQIMMPLNCGAGEDSWESLGQQDQINQS